MDPRTVLDELGGFATRKALLAAGVRRHSLGVALDQGRVVRLRRGVYGLGMPEGVARLRAAAVALNGVVSHDSAAVLWGLEMVHQPGQRITVPRNRSRARCEGVDVHRGDVGRTEVRQGLRVTTAVRTVLDCAAVLPLGDAVVVADSARRAGVVTEDELRSAAGRVRGRHAARVRRVAALADWGLLRFTWEDVRFHPGYVVEAVGYELAKPARRARRPREPRSTQKAA